MDITIRHADIGPDVGGVLWRTPDSITITFDPQATTRERAALLAEFLTDAEFSLIFGVPA